MRSLPLSVLSFSLLAAACGSTPAPPANTAGTGPSKTVVMNPALLQRTSDNANHPTPQPPPPPAPPPTGDDTQVSNAVRAQIVASVADHFPAMRSCYDTGTSNHPGLSGKVVVRFAVAPSGDVVTVDDDGSTLPDPDTVNCVRAVFTRMTFAKWDGKAVTVVYPIEFSMVQ